MVDISPLASTTTPNTASGIAANTLTSDFDAFLNLLTTQITNQDPTEPLDSSQFVEQLATFSAVEQQIATNSHLEQILSLLQSSVGDERTSLIGQQVVANSLDVQGSFDSIPIVAAGAGEGSLVVTNQQGLEVFRSPPGTSWSWDGRDANGVSVEPGVYQFAVQTDTDRITAQAATSVDYVVTTSSGQSVGLDDNVTSSDYTVL